MKLRITLEVDVCERSLTTAKEYHPDMTPAQVWLNDYDMLFQVIGQGGSPADECITLVDEQPVA